MASLSSGTRKISFSKENKLSFRGSIAMPQQRDFAPKVPSPLVMNHPPSFRPEYKRTLSTKIHSVPNRSKYGHRRTQSLNMPETQINQTSGVRNDLRKGLYNRSSSNIANTREFYAAPAYNEASLLERQESIRSSTRSVSSNIIAYEGIFGSNLYNHRAKII